MSRTLKSFVCIATTALIALSAGCGAVEDTNPNEEVAAISTISQALGTTFTITSWPATFPVQANAAPATAAITVSNGLKILFNVAVATESLPAGASGLVTISNFSYAGVTSSSPSQVIPVGTLSSSKNFTRTGITGYSIQVAVTKSGPTYTIQIGALAVPGGTIATSSTTLCTDT